MEEEKREWKRLKDFAPVLATSDDQMLNRYLAKDLLDRSESVDKVTGETKVSAQILMPAGAYLDQMNIQKINFFRNSGSNIEEIWICKKYFPQMKEVRLSVGVYEVQMLLYSGDEKKVVVFADNAYTANQIAAEYVAIYTDYGKERYVALKTETKRYQIDADICENIAEKNAEETTTHYLSYYKIDASAEWTYKKYGNTEDPMKAKIEYICDAYEVSDAREKARLFIEDHFKDELLISSRIIKAQPYRADIFVPREYCDLFKEDK